MIRYSISETSVGALMSRIYWSQAWRVELHTYRTNWRGTVKCEKTLVAIIPFDYSADDNGRSIAEGIGIKVMRQAQKEARR